MDELVLKILTLLLCWAAFNTVSTLVLFSDIDKIKRTLRRVLPSRYWKELE